MPFTLLGIGIWLALIMFINVWGVIWPNQKIALGIEPADDARQGQGARIAMLVSAASTCCCRCRC